MSSHDKRRLKRKIEECHGDENDEGRAAKEAKVDPAFEKALAYANGLNLLRLLPEDWAYTGAPNDVDEETSVEESSEGGSVSRGTLWTGKDVGQNSSLSQVSLVCERFPNGSDFDCETQTYYFVPKIASDAVEGSDTSHSNIENKKDHHNPIRVCCVEGCGLQSDENDPSTTFYRLPSSASERFLWAEILGVVFSDITANTSQEICCKHFITPKTMPCDSPKTPLPSRVPQVPKSKTRKKRTCDILIAEEAERVKQSMVTGRSKRTPKPNRNYDWAELIPLIKSEADDELFEMSAPKVPAKHSSAPGRRRKQLLDDIKREEKENEVPVINLHADFVDENGMADLENSDYGVDISLPSIPRQPPPKPKGRPHRIRDTCTQTDGGLCASREPLREVKVQCNLTAEPLVCCSSCSNIDWMSLEEELTNCISLVEGDLCNPVLVKCLRKVLDDVTKPSYASNALKILSGIEKDILESCKDIVLVSSQDEFDEVEIENVIHQEEAPITGVREITPKLWSKKASKGVKQIGIKIEDIGANDTDSFGLKEATENDDEEFHPEYSALDEDEEEEDDDLEEIDDDDDWDIKKEDESGVPITKKKKPRRRLKKGHQSLGGGTEDQKELKNDEADDHCNSSSEDNERTEVVESPTKIFISKEGPAVIKGCRKSAVQKPVERKVNRNAGDERWRRGIYKCPKCNKNFTTRLKMDRHRQHVHMGIAPWKGTHLCEECGKTFTQKIGLRIHRMHKHGDPKLFQCLVCSYKGVTRAKLARHVMTHYDDKVYSCEVCGMALKSRETYKNHMPLHTNEGKYRCDVCQKAFHHKQYYDDHCKSHFNIRDYKCEVCQTAFKTRKSLRTHVRGVHLNDKRIICSICGARFMTNYNLRSHLKKHERAEQSGAKYSCNLCKQRFHSEAGLFTHRRVTHPDYYQPIQIRIEASKTAEVDSIINETCIIKAENEIYAAEVEHIIEEIDTNVCDAIPGSLTGYNPVGPIETVEAVVEDSGEGGPTEHISIVYVFACDTCGSMFRSQDLLNFHKQSVHSI